MVDLIIPDNTLEEARRAFRIALRELLDTFGYKRVSNRLGVDMSTLTRWVKGQNKAEYGIAMEVMAWAELSKNSQAVES